MPLALFASPPVENCANNGYYRPSSDARELSVAQNIWGASDPQDIG